MRFRLALFTQRRSWQMLYSKLYESVVKPVSVESALDTCVRTYVSPRAILRRTGRCLRILFVAPKDDYGNSARGLGIEENYFFHTLCEMGHEVIRFDSLGILRQYGQRNMNQMLLEAVYRYKPDLAFCVLFTDEFEPATIKAMTAKTVTLNWFCDDHWRFENYSRHWAPFFTWVITTAMSAVPKYAAAGLNNAILSQWACNHRLYYKMDVPKVYDVSFIGLPHGNRPQIIQQLRQAGLDVRVWGYGWEGGRISQYKMVELINQSRINLNLSNASTLAVQQIKGRNFEIPGCGGFLLTEQVENLGDYYAIGREIACFDDVPHLIDQIRYFLAHEDERERIAEAGHQRTLRAHTFDMRFNEIFVKTGLH
jgi:spore maturation protein CgeB